MTHDCSMYSIRYWLAQFLTCIQFSVSEFRHTPVLVLALGIGIGIGQYYWVLGTGCLFWYRSNPRDETGMSNAKVQEHCIPITHAISIRTKLAENKWLQRTALMSWVFIFNQTWPLRPRHDKFSSRRLEAKAMASSTQSLAGKAKHITGLTCADEDRVARYPVFQGSSRIWAPISRLPERSYPGNEISRISIRTCQSPVTTHGDTLYGPCIVAIAYTTTTQIMRNSTVCYNTTHCTVTDFKKSSSS